MEKEPRRDPQEEIEDLLDRAKEKGVLQEILLKQPESEEAKNIFVRLQALDWDKSETQKQEE